MRSVRNCVMVLCLALPHAEMAGAELGNGNFEGTDGNGQPTMAPWNVIGGAQPAPPGCDPLDPRKTSGKSAQLGPSPGVAAGRVITTRIGQIFQCDTTPDSVCWLSFDYRLKLAADEAAYVEIVRKGNCCPPSQTFRLTDTPDPTDEASGFRSMEVPGGFCDNTPGEIFFWIEKPRVEGARIESLFLVDNVGTGCWEQGGQGSPARETPTKVAMSIGIERKDSGVAVSWLGVQGEVYQVLGTTDLVSWEPVSGPIEGTYGLISAAVATSPGRPQFFKVMNGW